MKMPLIMWDFFRTRKMLLKVAYELNKISS